MKMKNFFLSLTLVICLLVRYNLYSKLIPSSIYEVINPRQLQGLFNLGYYLGLIIQVVLIVSIAVNHKKMKIQDFIIVLLSILFLLSFVFFVLTI